ncbi:MAG: hypothetical protein ABEH83_14050 [Halobacterium sp.]
MGVADGVTDENEFYWLWIAATTAYGVGDVVTTVALVFYAPHVQEGNPLVAAAVDSLGLAGLVALKLAVFLGCLALSVYAMHAWRDRTLYAFPPLLLAALGTLLTAVNVRLLLG